MQSMQHRSGWILTRALELMFNSRPRLTCISTAYNDPASNLVVNLRWFDEEYVIEPLPVQVTIPIRDWVNAGFEVVAPSKFVTSLVKVDILDAIRRLDVPRWVTLDSRDKTRPGNLYVKLHNDQVLLDLEYTIIDGWVSQTRFRVDLKSWNAQSKAPSGYCNLLGPATDFNDKTLRLERRGTYGAKILFQPFEDDDRLLIVFPLEDPDAKNERGTPLMIALSDYQAARWLLERTEQLAVIENGTT